MLRTISVHLELEIRGHTNMVFSTTPALGANIVTENLAFVVDGVPQEYRELVDIHGTRLHTFISEKGRIASDCGLAVEGRATPVEGDERVLITYLRPSRYCQSDSLTPTARS